MEQLKIDLELRRKVPMWTCLVLDVLHVSRATAVWQVEIHEIEERKNQHGPRFLL